MRFKKQIKTNFTMINNQILKNKDLSWKAKGILSYLISLPDDWEIHTYEIMEHSTDGETSFRSGLKELIEHKYVIYTKTKDEKGHYEYCYEVYDEPQILNIPDVENQDLENHHNNNTNNTNNNNLLHKSLGEPQNKGKGLKPLIDYVNEKFNKDSDLEIRNLLVDYLKCHIGCRRLPEYDVWIDMISGLISYSSIPLRGAEGEKFLNKVAIEIITKAINGKDGAPYTDFDDIYGYGKRSVMGPQINLNQDFKGY